MRVECFVTFARAGPDGTGERASSDPLLENFGSVFCGFFFGRFWDWQRVALGELALVPVRVDRLLGAGSIEFGDLVGGQIPALGGQILAKLLLIASSNDDRGDGRPLQKPVQSDLRNGLSGLAGDRVQSVDDSVEVLILNLRTVVGSGVEAAGFGQWLTATDFASKASPAERAPDESADFLVESKRHQLPFILTANERVIDLVGDVSSPAVTVGDTQRLHQMPAGKIGAGDVADFTLTHKLVQRIENLFDRRQSVEAVKVVDVHVIGVETAQAALQRDAQMRAGGAKIVRPVSHAEVGLGRDQRLVAPAFERFAQDFLGEPAGVDIGSVEEVDSGVEADVEETAGFGHVGVSPCLEKLVAAPESGDSKTKRGNFEAGASEKSIFHVRLDALALAPDAEETATGARHNLLTIRAAGILRRIKRMHLIV